jgi:hypothetical protein
MEGMGDWGCNVSERHGLYVLRGVFPTLQPVVCQACMRTPVVAETSAKIKHDCKLRELWHARLGHPGKTASERIEREKICALVYLFPCCPAHSVIHIVTAVYGGSSLDPHSRRAPAAQHGSCIESMRTPSANCQLREWAVSATFSQLLTNTLAIVRSFQCSKNHQ